MKIYISGGLTHITETATTRDMKKIYENITELCRKLSFDTYTPHIQGTDPIKNPEVTAEDVWQKDFEEVNSADIIISYVGQPSLGTGAELEMARMADKNLIIWWFEDEKVSRMAKGNPAAKIQIEASDKNSLFTELKQALSSI